MIEKLLNVDLVEAKVKVETWEDAVRMSGLVLLKNKKIKEEYIEAMVSTVRNMGSYIVISRGVAMPHGRPKDGALENSISIITLEEPVVFGNEEFDPVSLVVALCAKDSKEHIELLKDLTLILDDDNLLDKASKCISKEELVNLILDIYNENL